MLAEEVRKALGLARIGLLARPKIREQKTAIWVKFAQRHGTMLQGDTFHGIIPWIDGLSFVGIIASVVKGSDWLDSLLNDEGRAAIAKWLKSVPPTRQDKPWPTVLFGLIDRVFGERPFSVMFFLRSCLASILAVVIVWLVYARLQLRGGYHHLNFWAVIETALFTSLVPDYLSLLISRTIIRMIPRNPRLSRIVFLLITDTVLSIVISILSLAIGKIVYSIVLWYVIVFEYRDFHWNMLLLPLKAGSTFISITTDFLSKTPISTLLNLKSPASMGWSITIYSAFFTSVWLWLYVISGLAIKVVRRIRFVWVRVSKYLDIDKKPLGCIGKVSGLLLASLWAVFIGLEHALHFLRAH